MSSLDFMRLQKNFLKCNPATGEKLRVKNYDLISHHQMQTDPLGPWSKDVVFSEI